MKMKFRLVLDLTVKIKKGVKVKDKARQQHLELLLNEFLKDPKALLNLYKIWFLADLQNDEYTNKISKALQIGDEEDIIKKLVKNLPDQSKEHFLEMLDRNDRCWFEEFEPFFDQVCHLKFDKASFEALEECP